MQIQNFMEETIYHGITKRKLVALSMEKLLKSSTDHFNRYVVDPGTDPGLKQAYTTTKCHKSYLTCVTHSGGHTQNDNMPTYS